LPARALSKVFSQADANKEYVRKLPARLEEGNPGEGISEKTGCATARAKRSAIQDPAIKSIIGLNPGRGKPRCPKSQSAECTRAASRTSSCMFSNLPMIRAHAQGKVRTRKNGPGG
jgi:hypothetical protein